MKRAGTIAVWTTLHNAIREYWSRAFTGPKELILVAESNPVLRRDLVDVLRDAHYRTIEACDGAEAVRIGARCRRQIHLLITGIRLPDLIGWELGELLRFDHPAVAVVYVAHNFQDWRRLGSKRFESLFLQVPFRPEAVLDVVRLGLHTHRELDSRLRRLGVLPNPGAAHGMQMAKGFTEMAGLRKLRSALHRLSSMGTSVVTPECPGKPDYGSRGRDEIRTFVRRPS